MDYDHDKVDEMVMASASKGRLNRYYRLAPLSCRKGATMVCPERTSLQDVYAAAIDRHAKAVKALGNASDAVFDKALNDASSSRLEAEFAGLAVEEHRATHGC